jgi:hypothetical protein
VRREVGMRQSVFHRVAGMQQQTELQQPAASARNVFSRLSYPDSAAAGFEVRSEPAVSEQQPFQYVQRKLASTICVVHPEYYESYSWDSPSTASGSAAAAAAGDVRPNKRQRGLGAEHLVTSISFEPAGGKRKQRSDRSRAKQQALASALVTANSSGKSIAKAASSQPVSLADGSMRTMGGSSSSKAMGVASSKGGGEPRRESVREGASTSAAVTTAASSNAAAAVKAAAAGSRSGPKTPAGSSTAVTAVGSNAAAVGGSEGSNAGSGAAAAADGDSSAVAAGSMPRVSGAALYQWGTELEALSWATECPWSRCEWCVTDSVELDEQYGMLTLFQLQLCGQCSSRP